ncbi:uncharacterized protein LOC135685893 [Rhopilema esculentum]|uniref:uncharacterized protein LOC135685893 n=1 Tax=Rhopilema esculentum TaxID=499914 RepID=UPI0031E17D93
MEGDTKIWIKHCKDKEQTDSFDLKEIVIKKDMTSKAIKATLLEEFDISQEHQVVKLRNSRDNLIPINDLLTANSPKKAYTLEVCKMYNAITPRPRTVSLPTYQQLLRKRLQNIDSRLLKLEQTVPRLPEIRVGIIEKEMTDLTLKMDFLNQKIQAAESYQWKGMFQRNPLW